MTGRLKLGMVGGGKDAFIGAVHRIASRIDDEWELVAGALSSTPGKSLASGRRLGLQTDRIYGSYVEMVRAESARSDGVDAVSIVTPNHMHADPAVAFLEAGIHVICDKPMAHRTADAERIAAAARASGKRFILTHNYTGYPLVREAREMATQGELGKLRLVVVEYLQDWLAEAPGPENKQAVWRLDPERSGAGGCISDIGTHAFNLVQFVTGLEVKTLSADLTSFVDGRSLDDNAYARFRFKGGAKGTLMASQVAVGHENDLTLRVYGDKGSVCWAQENPNMMLFTPYGGPKRVLTRGGASSSTVTQELLRVPSGHPEGYLEGFATIYREAAALIRGEKVENLPGVEAGLAGMRFIEACIESSAQDGVWIEF